jgi:hypothetical protein
LTAPTTTSSLARSRACSNLGGFSIVCFTCFLHALW